MNATRCFKATPAIKSYVNPVHLQRELWRARLLRLRPNLLIQVSKMDHTQFLDLHPRATLKIPSFQSEPDPPGPYKFFDIKFYPFETAWPIFAIVGVRHVLICRPPTHDDESIVILKSLCDRGDVPKTGPEPESLNSCEWNFVDPSEPLISVAGESGLIKIFNVLSGERFTTLVGHGFGTVNDLATHPQHPSILATASMDSSIRVWDLRRCSNKAQSPCIIICGHGQGHKEGILSITWHKRGRYLLSGGFDQTICVWTIPDLSSNSTFWDEISNPKRSAQAVRVIHYPHFTSAALHDNYVDCVLFYGDLVLSKSSKPYDEKKKLHEEINEIVLWRIGGFNSRLEPPPPEHAPKTKGYLDTRNGFMYTPPNEPADIDRPDKLLYERLVEFFIPNSEHFYMRFGLLEATPTYPDLHPILTFGNHRSKVFFWDLRCLESGRSDAAGAGNRSYLQDPHKKLKAHLELTIPDFPSKKLFQTRGAGWSADGRWCVVVGESSQDAVATIFERGGQSDDQAVETTGGPDL